MKKNSWNKQEQTFICTLVCVRVRLLPHGSFWYWAIHQGAQTSVQTPHPMAVHRLLHTVNCNRLKSCSHSVMDKKNKNVCICVKRSFLYFQSRMHFVCQTAFVDKHILCQRSQALGKNVSKEPTGNTNKQVCFGLHKSQTQETFRVIKQHVAQQSFFFTKFKTALFNLAGHRESSGHSQNTTLSPMLETDLICYLLETTTGLLLLCLQYIMKDWK